MWLKRRAPSVLALAFSLSLILLGAGGCDQLLKSNGDPLDDLVGSWYATSFLMVNPANTAQQIEEVAQGTQMTLVITGDGHFTNIWIRPEEETEVYSGTISATETELTVTPSGVSPMHFTWSLSGEVLTLVNTNDYQDLQDWDDDGDGDPTTLTIVYRRSAANPALNDLLGAWSATGMSFTNLANPSQQVDMIAAGGYFTMKVATGGVLSVVIGLPGDEEAGGVRTGTVSLSGDSLLVTLPSDPDPTSKMGWSLVGGVLTLSMSPNYFDFDGDGSGEAARMELVLVRVTEPALNALNGTWVVEEIEYVNPFNPMQTVDVTPWIAAMTVELSGGVIDVYQIFLGDDTEVQHGTYSLFGDLLIADFEGDSEPSAVKVALSGGLLRFQSVSDHHDWDEDGEDEPAVMYATSSEYSGPGVGDITGIWTATEFLLKNPFDTEQTCDLLADGGVWTLEILAGGGGRIVAAFPGQEEMMDRAVILENHGPILEFHYALTEPVYNAFKVDAGRIYMIKFTRHDWDGDGDYSEPAVRTVELDPVSDIAAASDFAGDWLASSMVYRRVPGWTESYDSIAQGGAFDLNILSDLTYTGSMTPPAESPEAISGYGEVFGNLLMLYDNAEMTWTALKYDLSVPLNLTLWKYIDHFDFDDDGTDEPAVIELHFFIPTLGH
jgi:hypothetical protein